MDTAVCWRCVEDDYLKEIIQDKGELRSCSVCKQRRKAFTADELGEELGPLIREHFAPGEQVLQMGGPEDDNGWWEQEGDTLSTVVQEVLGQSFDFNDEIVKAVIDSESVREQDGEIAFFDDTANYVERQAYPYRYFQEWDRVLHELKHERRFFKLFRRCSFRRTLSWYRRDAGMESTEEAPRGRSDRACRGFSTIQSTHLRFQGGIEGCSH